MHVENSLVLTHGAVMAMLQAAIARADEIGQPQCIVIVDASGVTLGQIRMSGAKYLGLKSAEAKARTAASIRVPSDAIPEAVGPAIAAATGNAVTRLGGGLPIIVDDICVGGIGVGSGTAEQDKDVANAALNEIGGRIYIT
ncbi:heme-binding protein [Tateyamaria sp. syn59]|uniref:GlcG/HbpS family heme-binding protein n=1 Tax=Tateyamaria sp. syn59 TaxID=2576942 RepID=UPI0011BF79D4|nr:heme-binding protein [Tateyamaria sp. syn59]